MKKFAFFATALMVLASCSNTDELMGTGTSGTQSAKQAITFETPFVNKNTRGSGEVTNDNIKNLAPFVWGFAYTDENQPAETVIGSVIHSSAQAVGSVLHWQNNAWTYGDAAFWDPELTYDFVSVVNDPFNATVSTQGNVSGYLLNIPSVPFVQQYDNASVSGASSTIPRDILIAVQNGLSGAKGEIVSLAYQHLLSRLDVYAYYQQDATPITLKSLKLYLPSSDFKYSYQVGIHGKVVTKGTWTNTTEEYLGTSKEFYLASNASSASELIERGYEAYELISTDSPMELVSAEDVSAVKNDADKYICPKGFYIAPCETDLSSGVYLEAEYMKGEETVKVPLTNITGLDAFAAGHYTKLYLRINGNGKTPISFETSVSGWVNTASGQDVRN